METHSAEKKVLSGGTVGTFNLCVKLSPQSAAVKDKLRLNQSSH